MFWSFELNEVILKIYVVSSDTFIFVVSYMFWVHIVFKEAELIIHAVKFELVLLNFRAHKREESSVVGGSTSPCWRTEWL